METQLVNLKLCLYGGKETLVERSFDKTTTIDAIQQEIRSIFNISSDRETKLWLNGAVFTYKPSDDRSNQLSSSSDSKENISLPTVNNSISTNNNISINNNNVVAITNNSNSLGKSSPSSSTIEPPPTPPPMPGSQPGSYHQYNNNIIITNSDSKSPVVTPSVVTRQAANSMNKQQAIALPDSSSSSSSIISTSPNTKSATTTTTTLASSSSTNNITTSPNSNQEDDSATKANHSAKTLTEAGVADSTIVTLEVINSDGTWPSSRPRLGLVTTRSSKAQPGLCGLSNMGNTCFMNSALQCLSNSPPLTRYILTDKFVDDINTMNPLGMRGEIARTYAELIKVMWSGNNSSFLPRDFKCAVSRFAPQFTGFAQQDCQELMAFLLDGLHEDLNRIKNKPYIEVESDAGGRPDEEVARESWENYKKRNDSIVVDTFHAMLKSTLVCPECQLVSVTFDPFCYLSLPLPVKREKQVNLTFLPAPSKLDETKIQKVLKVLDPEDVKVILQYGGRISSFDGMIEEHAGYSNPKNRPKGCKIQVPRSGPASELCEIVARLFNEERSSSSSASSSSDNEAEAADASAGADGDADESFGKVKPENLVVAELAVGRISKIYESSEHYNQICDDIVVIEKASKYALPLYVKERKGENDSSLAMSKLLFLHVPDLKYETLYQSIIASLSDLTSDSEEDIKSWCKLTAPQTQVDSSNHAYDDGDINFGDGDDNNENQMDCDNNEENKPNLSNDNAKHESSNDNNEASKTNSRKSPTLSNTSDSALVSSSTSSPKSKSTTTTATKPTTTTTPNKVECAFDLSTVNSYGNHALQKLGPNKKDCDYSSKLYIGATFINDIASTPQFEHNRSPKSETVDTFIPKVSLKPTLQLKDCITQFTNAERLGADDPWYCPKCKKHQQAFKKFDVWSLPKVLIIHLKRFSFSRSWRDKIDTLVEFPVEGLDMTNYVHNPEQKKQGPLVYNLIGVANHFGGLGGGHYTAFAKNDPLNAWYSFDDANVTQKSANNVVTRSAYVLFYQLQEEPGQDQ